MSRTIAVFGATGHQGASVVHNIINDPVLAAQYKIKAITRDPSSAKAKALTALPNVTVVTGDTGDQASLDAALEDVHVVFAMTNESLAPDGFDLEVRAGEAVADAAQKAGVEHLIFSTLPSAANISSSKYTTLHNYEAKHKVEQYIRSLPIKSSFVAAGFFMENFHNVPFLAPRQIGQDWLLEGLGESEATWPLLATQRDYGKFVGAVLADLDAYNGKTLWAAEREYTMDEIARIMSQSSSKTITYKKITPADLKAKVPVDFIVDEFSFIAEYGCWGAQQASTDWRGRLSSFEDFLQERPLAL